MTTPSAGSLRRRLSHELARRRRLAVAVLTGVAVVTGLSALRPSPQPMVRVWVAARDLSGGSALRADDLVAAALPRADVPSGALLARSPLTGRLLAAPVRRREPLTDLRLLSPILVASVGDPSDVAVPVRVADGPAALALVRAGDRVDVIGAAAQLDGPPTPATTVARGVTVLAVPPRDAADSDGSGDVPGLIVVAATSSQATALAQAAGVDRLSVAVERSAAAPGG
jgi:Flp pilus assembly protein CpaB